MNKLLISTIFLLTFCAWTFRAFSPQERINQDLKKLNLEDLNFETDSKKRKKHRDVVQDIKKNFFFSSDVLSQSELKEYTYEDLSIREWKYEKEGKNLIVQEFYSENKDDYSFYYLLVNNLSAAKESHYLSEETFGLISYRVNNETTSVKKKDRRSYFPIGKTNFETQVKEFISEK